MSTGFIFKPGRYYVRCIVFNNEGQSTEIIINSVTTSGNSLTFDYEGKPAKISLPSGQYKLEVWGAKGGDSTGDGYGDRGSSTIQGGLGGYSRGILRLNKEETVYVFVGEGGRPSNSSDGSTTKGGFPDGGGTKTIILRKSPKMHCLTINTFLSLISHINYSLNYAAKFSQIQITFVNIII